MKKLLALIRNNYTEVMQLQRSELTHGSKQAAGRTTLHFSFAIFGPYIFNPVKQRAFQITV